MTTILVAAEAKWVRDQVRSAFVGPGQEVVEVTRGQDVRAKVAELEPDLVVLDLQIGNMGGVAVAIDLRLEESGGRLPHARILLLLDRRHDAARPDDAILSEESKDSPLRLERERVWIVDPLDGTREWGEGRTDWAVHVALAFAGVPEVASVALPGQGQLLSTASPPPPPPPRPGPIRLLVSRTRPPAIAEY